RRSLAAALRYRTVPFPELVRHLQPANLPSGNPWCDILFAYQNLPPVRPSFAGLRTRLEALTLPYGQHPLKLEFLCDGTAYHCRVEYACEVLTRDAVRRL